MSGKVNLVRVLTSATGNSTPITLGAAYSQLFMTPAEAGAVDGRPYTYLIVDGNNWELGRGVYTASGTTLARTTVLASRISGTLGTTRLTLSGTAQVRFVESAEDMDGFRVTRTVSGTSDTIANTDHGCAITYSNASAIAASLAQAGASSQFLDGWRTWVKNTGVGTLTITPATSTINGKTTLQLPTNFGAMIWSDGTNYHAYLFLAVTNIPDALSALGMKFGQCKLIKSGSNIVLQPSGGNLLSVNGQGCTIPSAGVSLAPTGLTVGTLYYIYATASGGAVNALEASATGHSTSSTAGNIGVEIKTGDDTRTLVGMVQPTTGPAFTDTSTNRLVRSWFNDAGPAMTASFDVTKTTTSTSLTELDSNFRINSLVWSGELFTVSPFGSASVNAVSTAFTAVAFDSTSSPDSAIVSSVSSSSNYSNNFGHTVNKSGLSEGFHYATVLGGVTSGTGSWRVNVGTDQSGINGRLSGRR